MGIFIVKVAVRVAVRISINLRDIINKLVVSVWTYNKASNQAVCFQQPELLSTPGGLIALWASDFLSVEDDALAPGYQRPYKEQYVAKPPLPLCLWLI